MTLLWERMAALYPTLWVRDLGASPIDGSGSLTVPGDTWAKGLSGLTGEQLAAGLRTCATRGGDFPPSVATFRSYCLSIPSLSAVQRELANENSDRSGFAVLVWQGIDGYAYRRAEGKAADRMLKDAYDDARERVMAGEAPPPPRVALPPPAAPVARPASPEVAKAALAEMARTIGAMPDLRPEPPEDMGIDTT